MKETLKNLGSCLLYIVIFIGVILLIPLFLKGGLWLSVIIYPWLVLISLITFAICILILLPLAIFKGTRGASGIGFFIASYIFGATTWVWSFLLVYILWGVFVLIIGLFIAGIGVIPIAMLATLFNGKWSEFGQLALSVVLTLGFRFLGIYLVEKSDEAKRREQVNEGVEIFLQQQSEIENQKEAEEMIIESNIMEDEIIEEPKIISKTKNFCKKCGGKLDKDSEFCDSCGQKL